MSFVERTSNRRSNNATRRTSIFCGLDDGVSTVMTATIPKTNTPEMTTSTTTSLTTRRRKSRSPAAQARITASSVGKKRKSTASSSSAATSFASAIDEILSVDRGRKVKSKPKTQSRYAAENVASLVPHRSSVKERSKSRDSKERSRKFVSEIDPLEAKSVHFTGGAQSTDTGSFDATELALIKDELDILKKQAIENKKTISKQIKVIDELRQKLSSGEKTIKDNEQQIQKLKSKSKRSEETIAAIEGNINCQVCMETLLKPFALSPCGHVLCHSCLQEWFRKAPVNDGDMYDDDDPDYLMYRIKTCPCCRSTIRERPVPVFIVKSIAVALMKGKSGSNAITTSQPLEGDPWVGLFPPVVDDEYAEDDDNDENDDEDDEDDEGGDGDHYNEWATAIFAYGSGSEDEPYEGGYTLPQWQPPSIDIDPVDYEFDDLDNEDLNVLRRGATIEMLDMYQMTYTHAEGLVANVDDGHKMYLGWNIRLSADDDDGQEYMTFQLSDMLLRPERWNITDMDGIRVCRKLVPEDEVEDYGTTDSEVWIDDN